MKRDLIWSTALSLAVVVCAEVRSDVDWTVSSRGEGPVHVGMSLAQVRRVLRDAAAGCFEGAVRTDAGAGTGDSEERIRPLHPGRITAEPHHYDPQGHYLKYSPTAAAGRQAFRNFKS